VASPVAEPAKVVRGVVHDGRGQLVCERQPRGLLYSVKKSSSSRFTVLSLISSSSKVVVTWSWY
jgi:hypothetical protein